MDFETVMKKLNKMGRTKMVEGMKRFVIEYEKNIGITVTDLRNFAREIGTNHKLAIRLWKTGIRDAQFLAACIEDPKTVSEKQVESWLKDITC